MDSPFNKTASGFLNELIRNCSIDDHIGRKPNTDV